MAATVEHPFRTAQTAVIGYLVVAVAILIAAAGVLGLRGGGAPAVEETVTLRSSSTAVMIVEGGRNVVETSALEPITRDATSGPVLTMRSLANTPGGAIASVNDEVATVRVELVLRNDGDQTLVLPADAIALHMVRDGESVRVPAAPSPRVELTAGASTDVVYEVPVTADGTYEWWAEAAYVPGS